MTGSGSDAVSGTDDGPPEPATLDLERQVPLRLGSGWAGFDDDALYLDRGGERTRLAFDEVTELTYQDTDYFVVVLSLTLIGFGLWFVRRTPASLLFSLVGVASLARLYRHRGELLVRANGRPKPLTFHPADPGEFYDALGGAMGGEVVSDRQALFGN